MYQFVEVDYGHCQRNDDGDGIPDQFKCPVCLDIPPAEIYQCINGHVVCHNCVLKLYDGLCPHCRIPYEELIRVRTLEYLLEKVAFPCPYKSAGCQEMVTRKEIDAHAKNCVYNGKCIQLCKHLGFPCDFYTNGLNGGVGVDHFESVHGTIKLSATAPVVWSCPIVLLVQNLKTYSTAKNKADLWTPVTLSVNQNDHFMIVHHCKDECMSWLCVKMNQEQSPNPAEYEVEFDIESQSRKMPNLRWKVPPVSMMNVEEVIKCSAFRTPIPTLIKYYTDEKEEVIVNVTVRKIPLINPTWQYNEDNRPAVVIARVIQRDQGHDRDEDDGRPQIVVTSHYLP